MPNLPPDFLENAKRFAGAEYEAFISSLDDRSPVSIRLNPFKQAAIFESEEKIVWSEQGRYLSVRPSFTLDPLFHAGCYYVQDASSQFLEVAFLQAKKKLNRPLRVLDLCAAPGGKSTHILSMLDENDILVSNEIITSRNHILRQNIHKWGCANVIVTQNDAEQLSNGAIFDMVIIDAPCSGEGLFRKDTDAIGEWSRENVNRCSIRQKDILNQAFRMIKPGGILIYSTCTFEETENDLQILRMITEFGMTHVPFGFQSGQITTTKYGYLFFPHRVKGEGFYISMLQKNSDEHSAPIKSSKQIQTRKENYSAYIKNSGSFNIFENNENSYAIPKTHFDFFNHIRKFSYIRHAGIHLGEKKGNDFVPSESLALSVYASGELPGVNVDEDVALDYLRGNNISIEAKNGFNLVRYKNFNLGWLKKIGNRANNYYPKEWRIKHV